MKFPNVRRKYPTKGRRLRILGRDQLFRDEALHGAAEQFERLGEFVLVVAVGAMLAWVETPWPGLALAVCLFAVIRPLATLLALAPVPSLALRQRAFIAWFGVRGVGSIYYLTYAFSHGLGGADARSLADATLVVVAASVVLHGISVTPLMRWHESRRGRPTAGR